MNRPNNAILSPAHPWLAAALCRVGSASADVADFLFGHARLIAFAAVAAAVVHGMAS